MHIRTAYYSIDRGDILIYEPMCPPFDLNDFDIMTKKEAKKHFDWYITEIPKRINILKDAYEFTGGGIKEDLNFTPESLVKLWKWFIPYVTEVNKTTEEIEEENNSTPEWLLNYIVTTKLSFETLALIKDISIYFGEVFISNYPQLRWDVLYKPKNLFEVNRPVILGFSKAHNLFTDNIVTNLARKVSKGNLDEEALYKIFKVWEEYI